MKTSGNGRNVNLAEEQKRRSATWRRPTSRRLRKWTRAAARTAPRPDGQKG